MKWAYYVDPLYGLYRLHQVLNEEERLDAHTRNEGAACDDLGPDQ